MPTLAATSQRHHGPAGEQLLARLRAELRPEDLGTGREVANVPKLVLELSEDIGAVSKLYVPEMTEMPAGRTTEYSRIRTASRSS